MADPTSASLDTVCDLLRDIRNAASRPSALLLTRDTLAALLDVGVSTFDRMKAAGQIGPRPVQCAGLKWHRDEVTAWLAHRDPSGELHDAKTWPTVWQQIQARTNRAK